MSTFGGLTKEYPQVALDLFSGKDVLKARAYFLSHVHTDHMVGLHSDLFASHLKKHPCYKLYCSEVTREFLLTSEKHCHLRKSLVALPILQPCELSIPNDVNGENEKLSVTLLPAGHCPGSVMFLLEGSAGRVLYTGDFRLKKGDAAHIEPLHNGDIVKPIRSLYIDTTFFDPKVMYIPNREQSCEALLRLIEEQLQRGPQHMVHIKCKAKYGYEFLFVEIAKAFNMKVHVSREVMRQYDRVPDLAEHMTTEGSTTRVHACRQYSCNVREANDVITIIPSTMWFNSNAEPDDVLKRISSRTYRLCFSFHSSYSEICDFIRYLRPRNVYPNVIPYNATEYEMIERLQEVLKESPSQGQAVSDDTTAYQPLGQLKLGNRRKRKMGHEKEGSHNRSLDMLFEGGSQGYLDDKPSATVLDPTSHIKGDHAMGDSPKQQVRVSKVETEEGEDEEGNSDTLFSDESDSDLDQWNLEADSPDEEEVPTKQKMADLRHGEERVTMEEPSQDSSSNDGSPFKSFCRFIPENRRIKGNETMAGLDDNKVTGRVEQEKSKQISHGESPPGNLPGNLSEAQKTDTNDLASSSESGHLHVMGGGSDEAERGSSKISASARTPQLETEANGSDEKDGDHSLDSSASGVSPIKNLIAYLPKRVKLEEMNSRGQRKHDMKMSKGVSDHRYGNAGFISKRNSGSHVSCSPKRKTKELDSLGEPLPEVVVINQDAGYKSREPTSPAAERSLIVVSPVKSFLTYLPRRKGGKLDIDREKGEFDVEGGFNGSGDIRSQDAREGNSEEKMIGSNARRRRDHSRDQLISHELGEDPISGLSPTFPEMRGKKQKLADGCRTGEGDLKLGNEGDRVALKKAVSMSNGEENVHIDGKRSSSLSVTEECFTRDDVEPVHLSHISETGLSSKGTVLIDLTVEDDEGNTLKTDDRDVFICSQDTVKSSASVRSSQETYLSPSKLFTNNSQEPFLVSSPESSDATPDFIQLP